MPLGGSADGLDITNSSVAKSMQALLTELTNVLSSDEELKVKNIKEKSCYLLHTKFKQLILPK
jgi:hypothetical protein